MILNSKQFQEEYAQETLALQLRGITIGNYTAMVCLPLFNVLDFFLIPGQQVFFLELRLLSTAILGAGILFAKIRVDFVKRHLFAFTYFSAIITTIPIIVMIKFYKGHESPYYVGLILIITCTSLIIPWSIVQGGIVYGTIYAGYLGCIFIFDDIIHWSLFINNNFFLSSFILFSLLSLYIQEINRKKEFLTRIELRKANITIKSAYDKLEQLDKLKTNFFSNVSHEIRTPLTLIMGPLQNLLVEPVVQANSKVQQHLKIMLKNAKILYQLLSDLLDFSKLESGKASLSLEVMSLTAQIHEIISSFASAAENKKITIFFKNECNIPLLQYDPYKMERVLYNLLSNAIKFTPSGGEIIVNLKKEEGDLKISVKDTGIGIQPEEQKRIFDRFCQADEGSKRQHGGTGIGLSLVKEFTELHGGTVRVDSEPGKGSVFTVKLPYESLIIPEKRNNDSDVRVTEFLHKPQMVVSPSFEKQNKEIMPIEKKTPSVQSRRQAFTRQQILVIEDNSDIADYINSILSPYFTVITAENGQEGYETACNLKPDLILSDWMMPLKTGVEVCREVKDNKELARIPFVLLTSKAETEAKVDALESGADDYLTKPFDKKELLARIANLLKSRDFEIQLQKKNIFLAHYDTLTKLPNRRLFINHLTQSLSQARFAKQQVAIAYIHLDRFAIFNKTLGYAAGDLILQAVAEHLTKCARAEDFLARLEGGDFIVMFLGDSKVENIDKIIQNIIRNVTEMHYSLNGHKVTLTTSIGLSIFPTDGEDSEILLNGANIALNRAKEEGGNTYRFYKEEMNKQLMERFVLETHLRRALQKGEFLVYYQPKVDIRKGCIIGAEALVRWKHQEWGLLNPSKFIPLAEELGLVSKINEWVLLTACKQNKAWQQAGLPPIQVSVNLSSQQFSEENLIAYSERVLKATDLDIKYLDFEVTESSAMKNAHQACAILHKLKTMGASISIDDFGTGYSSLSYLQGFPIHTVKIDQSFIRDMNKSRESKSIVIAIVAMVHSLGLKVVAEGVEDEEQLAFLRSINCDAIQGYLFSQPIPAVKFGNLLAGGKCLSLL
ncbi:MAG: EAL domain-containing protein [Candidatus Brocadiaceae bacterium]|nr:EAL domain-containing protein [Candidatus Brocadiaceae bacterium]